MPKDNLHYGNVEHRALHNQNGQLFHLATAMVRINPTPTLQLWGDPLACTVKGSHLLGPKCDTVWRRSR